MYNTREEFAVAMSEQLFQMRIEDSSPYGDDDIPVPMDYAHQIVDNPAHILLIKKRIRDSVITAMCKNLSLYRDRYNGFVYTPDVYDHAFAVDAYVDELYIAEQQALEDLEEDQRQARLIVTYVVRTEVERQEYDPETEETEYVETDSGECGGKFNSYDEAIKAQQKGLDTIRKHF
jgi:hypothetical protein